MAAFDLFYLFVENVFGNILLAGVGIAALLFFIGMISKMSPISIYAVVTLFLMSFSIGYFGGLGAFIIGILALIYFFRGLINFVAGWA